LVDLALPREVVRAAGVWIADRLRPDGFVWLPSQLTLQRSLGTLRHQIHMQPSKYNRRGGPVTVQTMLNVRDTALRRWGRLHQDLVLVEGDYVCGHPLGYGAGRANGYLYGEYEDGEIDLSVPAERERRLAAFVRMVREAVLPWFVEASDPDLILSSRAADKTSEPERIVGWLASRGRVDLVPAFAERYLRRHPGWADGYAHGATLAARGRRPGPADHPAARPPGRPAARLGWAVAQIDR
jgi:hypothetical protein